MQPTGTNNLASITDSRNQVSREQRALIRHNEAIAAVRNVPNPHNIHLQVHSEGFSVSVPHRNYILGGLFIIFSLALLFVITHSHLDPQKDVGAPWFFVVLTAFFLVTVFAAIKFCLQNHKIEITKGSLVVSRPVLGIGIKFRVLLRDMKSIRTQFRVAVYDETYEDGSDISPGYFGVADKHRVLCINTKRDSIETGKLCLDSHLDYQREVIIAYLGAFFKVKKFERNRRRILRR